MLEGHDVTIIEHIVLQALLFLLLFLVSSVSIMSSW